MNNNFQNFDKIINNISNIYNSFYMVEQVNRIY